MKLLVVAVSLWLAALPAEAAPVTVGVFAPSAPFPTTAARVELAKRLGDELGAALRTPASGRVYARAADFSAAVKRGEVTLAVVDAAYLAGTSGYTVLAVALHTGEPARAWRLVARGTAKLADLRARRVLVPSLGGRETELVLDVMFGGELAREFFRIEAAPDTASALAALALGKADAAVVPAGELPPGISPVIALPVLSNPLLVAYGAMTEAERDAVLTAAIAFAGDATITGFRAADAGAVQAIARRFSPPVKRSPFVVPAPRFDLDELVGHRGRRAFAIERTPATSFAAAIAPRAR